MKIIHKIPYIAYEGLYAMKIGKKCKIYIFILKFLVLFNVFRPSYDIYGILSIIFGFSDPRKPHFDILYVNVQKYF